MLFYQEYQDLLQSYQSLYWVNFMWILQNSMEIHDTLNKNGRNLVTYDFSTLYTSIPHEKLKEKLSDIVTRAFKGMNKNYIYCY